MIINRTTALALILISAGCASSTVGPGAGAAQAVVKGPVEEVSKRAQTVMQEMHIQVTGNSVKNAGNERQITGKKGDTDITVSVDNAPNATSNVEVAAGKNIVNGDRELAREILNKIVQRT